MVWWLPILLLFPLVILMISDIRSRTVSSWWLLAFGIPNIIFLWLLYGWKCVTGRVIGDLLLLLVIGTALLVYAKAKHMQLAELLGAGDVIFLMAISPAFGLADYIKYIVGSSLIGILIWPLIRKSQPHKTGVPMISVMALVYSVVMGYRLLTAQL